MGSRKERKSFQPVRDEACLIEDLVEKVDYLARGPGRTQGGDNLSVGDLCRLYADNKRYWTEEEEYHAPLDSREFLEYVRRLTDHDVDDMVRERLWSAFCNLDIQFFESMANHMSQVVKTGGWNNAWEPYDVAGYALASACKELIIDALSKRTGSEPWISGIFPEMSQKEVELPTNEDSTAHMEYTSEDLPTLKDVCESARKGRFGQHLPDDNRCGDIARRIGLKPFYKKASSVNKKPSRPKT
ncbi:MAG: hypothetical protein AB3N63_04850 [Puniceicoccaceae bacterium]